MKLWAMWLTGVFEAEIEQNYQIMGLRFEWIWQGSTRFYHDENVCTKEANNGIPQQIYYIVI